MAISQSDSGWLQRGRAFEGAERVMALPAVPLGPVLQRGRAFEGAERARSQGGQAVSEYASTGPRL